MDKKYCTSCGSLKDIMQFYRTNTPANTTSMCKQCIASSIDVNKSETFFPYLQEIDVPYVEDQWKKQAERSDTALLTMGKYLAVMRLKGWKNYRWSHTSYIKEMEERHNGN